MKDVKVEKIIVVGAPTEWSRLDEVSVTAEGARGTTPAELIYHGAAGGKAAWAVIRGPGTSIGEDWTISFSPGQNHKTEL